MQTLLIDQLVGHTVGGYRVERLLGQGRLNAVYLARHPAQNTSVALTTYLIPEQFSREAHNRFMVRFAKEANALTGLQHRNLLPVFAYGEQYGYPYLVTPYMMYGSLADQLKQRGRCTPTYVLEVLEQVAAGLDYAHRQGIIHGTLKPSNILLNSDGSIAVAGFGLTHMLQLRGIEQSNHSYAHLLSIADTFLGPPEYMAPEIVQGQSIDVRSDIYALGIIVFELLSGRPPFTGTNALEIAMQHVQQQVPSLHALCPDIPLVLELVINHTVARDPAQRFQRAGDMVEAFAQVCKGITPAPSATTGRQRVPSVANYARPDTSHDSLTADSIPDDCMTWQLMPPIVTSKTQAVQSSTQRVETNPRGPALVSSGSWQLVPPIVTGKLEAIQLAPATPRSTDASVPVSPAQKRAEPMQPAAQVRPVSPAPIAPSSFPTRSAQPDYANSQSRQVHDYEANPAASSWRSNGVSHSEPLHLSVAEPTVPRSEPLRAYQMPSQPLVSMKMEAVKGSSKRPARAKASPMPGRRSRGMGRRRAIALLATGGVVAAGAAVAVNLKLIHLGTQGIQIGPAQMARTGMGTANGQQGQQKNVQQPQQGKGNGTTATTTQKKQTPPKANTVGSTTLAANSAAVFNNPADGKGSLLIHLPSNKFVAYESACTHEGVTVNYDPATRMLVCPAHGSIFDPAMGAKVIQGPARTPLKPVAIRVNADSTITTV